MPFRWWKKSSETSTSIPKDPKVVQKLGLTLLNKIAEPCDDRTTLCDVDIVFVHGLGGHFQDTWTFKTGTKAFFWPLDHLAANLPGARIFSYGYATGGLRATKSKARIRDFSKSLLESLRSKRQHEQDRKRPILFMSHSLGGIVVKQAIILARSDSDYESIWLRTIGIIFLGTPHRGSMLADDALLLAVAIDFTFKATSFVRWKGSIDTSTLRLLQKDKQQLNDITTDFLSCLKQRPDIKIISFYETKLMTFLNDLVVSQASAQLGTVDERFLPLNADHREVCRFQGSEDPNLELVYSRICDLLGTSERMPNNSSFSRHSITASVEGSVKDCVPFLNTVDLSQYSDLSKRKADGTLQWFLHNPKYLYWTTNTKSGILWISGFAGSGKTTLTLYVKQCLLNETRKDYVVAAFFCDDKDERQRSGLHILQSLIYQIAEQCRGLWRFVTRAKDKHGPSHFQRLDGLWQVLEQIISSHTGKEVAILLDAIDECEARTRKSILERLYALSKKEMDTTLRIFVTSRFDARSILEVDKNSLHVTEIWLDDYSTEIAQDISVVVHQTLQRLVNFGKCQPDVQDLIAAAFIAKADKTFLWAKFALDYLEKRRSLFRTSISDITSLIPQGLEDVYFKYLSTIPHDDIENAARLLRYIIACDRPLTTEELSTIITMDVAGDDPSLLWNKAPFIDDRQITNLLGSLVRLEDNKVYLVHQTLKDYLTSLEPQNPLFLSFVVHINQVKAILTRNCALYIKLCLDSENRSESTTTRSSNSQRDLEVDQGDLGTDLVYGMDIFEDLGNEAIESRRRHRYTAYYKFFDYAALHWQADLLQASTQFPSEAGHLWDAAYNVYDRDDHAEHSWFRYFWSHRLPAEIFPSTTDCLMKAAFAGHLPIVRRILQSTANQAASVSQALYWAIRYDHELCVDVLMSSRSVLNVETKMVQDPLSIAAEYGSLRSVPLLLKADPASLNRQSKAGKTALMLAAGHGQAMVVKLLLQESNLDFNICDSVGRSAIHWAIYSESTETSRILIDDTRTKVDIQDQHGRSPLIEAAESNLLDIIKLLLKRVPDSINQQDHVGRTALSYACGNGHLSVVKRLCKAPNIDLLCPDKRGRVAHSWAACQNNTAILRFLITKAPNGTDIPDHDGWAPFAWTLGPPAIVPNAMALLEQAKIDVNRRDNSYGRPLLNWLAGYGETLLVKILLQQQSLNKCAADDQGRTPLMDAAIAGHTNTVTLLVQEDFTDINVLDNDGRSALALAVRGGRLQTVVFLAGVVGIQTDCTDNDGQTPLDTALQFGHMEIVTFLQELRSFK